MENINYIESIYSKLKGNIVTSTWEPDVFAFLKGLFAGDPFSGTILFNSLIEWIKTQKQKQGYKIKV